MADSKISALPALAAQLKTTDELVINEAGTNKKFTGDRIIPTVLTQNGTGTINLALYFADVAIFSTPASGITITLNNSLLAGRLLMIINKSSTNFITLAGGSTYKISPEETIIIYPDGSILNVENKEGVPSPVNTRAGDFAHAEGINTEASGKSAHAEGGGIAASFPTNANKAPGDYAHVEGGGESAGENNDASGDASHSEGRGNTSSGIGSHAEGNDNVADGGFSHAEGGDNIVNALGGHAEGSNNVVDIAAVNGHASGISSRARLFSMFAFSSGSFGVPGTMDNQYSKYMLRGATTDNSLTELTNPGRFTLEDESSYAVTVTIHARRDTGADHAMYKRMVIIERTGGTVTLAGAVQIIGTDIETTVTYAISLTADDVNKSLNVSVQGAIGHNVRWVAVVEAVEMKYND